MTKRSSEKNMLPFAAALAAVLLLCLGGSFVFSQLALKDNTPTGSLTAIDTALFIRADYDIPCPDISARSAVLIEAGSGEVLISKNSDMRLPMASTTKIMTALVALESCDLYERIQIPQKAVGVEGSSIYLSADEHLTLEELLYAMMLESANDAAAAIAIHIGGSIEGFAEMMNARAEKMGLCDTHFENPHGLDGESHYTTARELALIAREAMSNEVFKTIVSTHKKTIPHGDGGVRLLINHNKLLDRYDGAIGVKTGFTKKSGRCLVSAAERDGTTFIAVTIGAGDDWNDHKKLLDCGFDHYETRTLCSVGSFSYILPVSGGDSDHVELENISSVTVTLPRLADEIKYTVELPRFCFAPTERGEKVGRLVYFLDGQEIAESPIVAKTAVNIVNKRLFRRHS